jgi:DNA-binding XRE family transcriptional regulator
MRICRPGFKIKIEISGPVTRRQRRAMLLGIFHRVSPLFRLIEPGADEYPNGSLIHCDGNGENLIRDLDRGIKLRQALKTETRSEKLGFEIRMLRLKKGLSQKKLANKLGIDRGNISEIEKGHHNAKPGTIEAIKTHLNALTDKPTFDARGEGDVGWWTKLGRDRVGDEIDLSREFPPELFT